jgi:putative intracellular protease/amidase
MDVVRQKQIDSWNDWHSEYDDPDSELAGRMKGVQRAIDEVVSACPEGPIQIVSICGGQGRDLVGALAEHPRRDDVRVRMVELDPGNVAFARRTAAEAGIEGFEVVEGDAGSSDAYAGLPPADLVVVAGLYGHLDDDDQVRLNAFLRQICREGGIVVWTFFQRARRRTERLRRYFVDEGFEEVRFEVLPGEEYQFTVALSRLDRPTEPFEPGRTVFTFGSSHEPLRS